MATATISHTVEDLSGDPVSGIEIRVELSKEAVKSDDVQAQRLLSFTTDANGAVAMVLEINNDLVPNDTYYTVTINAPASQGGPEVYTIEVTTSQSLHDARITVP